MTAAAWALGADPAPVSSSSHFYTTALNQIGREEERARERERATGGGEGYSSHPQDGNGYFKRSPENGPSPSAAPSRRGHQKSAAPLQQRILMIPWRLERAAGALTSL